MNDLANRVEFPSPEMYKKRIREFIDEMSVDDELGGYKCDGITEQEAIEKDIPGILGRIDFLKERNSKIDRNIIKNGVKIYNYDNYSKFYSLTMIIDYPPDKLKRIRENNGIPDGVFWTIDQYKAPY